MEDTGDLKFLMRAITAQGIELKEMRKEQENSNKAIIKIGMDIRIKDMQQTAECVARKKVVKEEIAGTFVTTKDLYTLTTKVYAYLAGSSAVLSILMVLLSKGILVIS